MVKIKAKMQLQNRITDIAESSIMGGVLPGLLGVGLGLSRLRDVHYRPFHTRLGDTERRLHVVRKHDVEGDRMRERMLLPHFPPPLQLVESIQLHGGVSGRMLTIKSGLTALMAVAILVISLRIWMGKDCTALILHTLRRLLLK